SSEERAGWQQRIVNAHYRCLQTTERGLQRLIEAGETIALDVGGQRAIEFDREQRLVVRVAVPGALVVLTTVDSADAVVGPSKTADFFQGACEADVEDD